jgi:hypothetical protein
MAASSSAKRKGRMLPNRANSVGGLGAGSARRSRPPSARAGCAAAALGVDHRRDAGRSGAQHRQPLLQRPQPRLREMLRRAPAPEPGIVGRIEEEGRPVLPVDHFAREDDLVAELEADLADQRQVSVCGPRAGSKSTSPGARRDRPSATGSAASADIRHRGRDAPCRSGRGSAGARPSRRRCWWRW